MSQKITGKNLHYDQTLPPFLARLKGQHAADADSPDPILASHRRAAKPRSASEEAEDAPLIVDDDGYAVSGMKVGADGTVKELDGGSAAAVDGEGPTEDDEVQENGRVPEGEKLQAAAIGGSKKRKVGKVIGADADAEEEEEEVEDNTIKNKDAAAGKGDSGPLKKDTGDKSKRPVKGKKKAKKIKLSFGDDEGD